MLRQFGRCTGIWAPSLLCVTGRTDASKQLQVPIAAMRHRRYRRRFDGVKNVGVSIYILDWRTVILDVDGCISEIGTLRYLSQSNEINDSHLLKIKAARDVQPSPVAAMLAEHSDFQTASGKAVRAHRVLGWDEGRAHVSDLGWDHLPTLGYAVRDVFRDDYVLHALVDGILDPVNAAIATMAGLLDSDGAIVRHGQMTIVSCSAVAPYIPGYIQADVEMSDGKRQTIVVRLEGDEIPDVDWFTRRRPRDVEVYRVQPG